MKKGIMKPCIYIASPYTQGDTALNVRDQIAAAECLREAGALPFVPLLSHLWHLMSPHPYNYWIEMDMDWLHHADAVLRLHGDSAGAEHRGSSGNFSMLFRFQILHRPSLY